MGSLQRPELTGGLITASPTPSTRATRRRSERRRRYVGKYADRRSRLVPANPCSLLPREGFTHRSVDGAEVHAFGPETSGNLVSPLDDRHVWLLGLPRLP